MPSDNEKLDQSMMLQQHMKQMRLKAKLTQVELAEKLGKPQSFISKIENGTRKISVVELNLLCAACNVDTTKFVQAWRKALKAQAAQ